MSHNSLSRSSSCILGLAIAFPTNTSHWKSFPNSRIKSLKFFTNLQSRSSLLRLAFFCRLNKEHNCLRSSADVTSGGDDSAWSAPCSPQQWAPARWRGCRRRWRERRWATCSSQTGWAQWSRGWTTGVKISSTFVILTLWQKFAINSVCLVSFEEFMDFWEQGNWYDWRGNDR